MHDREAAQADLTPDARALWRAGLMALKHFARNTAGPVQSVTDIRTARPLSTDLLLVLDGTHAQPLCPAAYLKLYLTFFPFPPFRMNVISFPSTLTI